MNECDIFLAALEIEGPAERATYLDRACAGDADLRRRIEGLLGAHGRAGDFLDRPAAEQLAAGAVRPEHLTEPGSRHAEAAGPAPERPSEPTQAERSHDEDAQALGFLKPSQRADSLGRLGHYEVLGLVGRGGMGVVLRAFDEVLHRVVAIKVLVRQLTTSATARKRFLREARAAAAVSHDNVVTLHAVEEGECAPYLVMQYVAGMSLQDKLDRQGPLELREVLRIGLQAAAGLAAAHAHGLVHRDIKPANILLENGVERVKVTDFGLARAADDASLTQSGVVAGTPLYMSPEQANGVALDHRSDLFSLGTVLYVMCTGRPPFRASGTMAVLKRVIDDTPRPIREINPEVPDWLCDLIGRLHAKAPADRYQTAKEVSALLGERLADLQLCGRLRGEAVSLPAAAAPLPQPTPRRHRARWLVAAIGLLAALPLLAIPAAILFWPRDGATPVRPAAGDPPVAEEATWVQLLNGKDLTGWKTSPAFPGDWAVSGATLVGKVNDGGLSLLCSERGDYENFHLRAVVKLGTGNSGVSFRNAADSQNGYHVEIIDRAGVSKTGSLLVHANGWKQLCAAHGTPSPEEDWVTLEVVASGAQITTIVNGKMVAQVSDATYRRGHVALEASGSKQGGGGLTEGTVVYFRKIEIKELPPFAMRRTTDSK